MHIINENITPEHRVDFSPIISHSARHFVIILDIVIGVPDDAKVKRKPKRVRAIW